MFPLDYTKTILEERAVYNNAVNWKFSVFFTALLLLFFIILFGFVMITGGVRLSRIFGVVGFGVSSLLLIGILVKSLRFESLTSVDTSKNAAEARRSCREYLQNEGWDIRADCETHIIATDSGANIGRPDQVCILFFDNYLSYHVFTYNRRTGMLPYIWGTKWLTKALARACGWQVGEA